MEPFLLSTESYLLKDQYPTSVLVAKTTSHMPVGELHGFLRLWVSEGIPFAFREIPMIYEAVREWLGNFLSVHPKTITIIGSARIGYSLAPPPDYGRPFRSSSDLDFVVVSETLFSNLSQDFWNWKQGFAEGRVIPESPLRKKYWEENVKLVPINIRRGFIDGNKIPYRKEYSSAQKIGQAKYLVGEKLKITTGAPLVRIATFRIYRDWTAFADQQAINLKHTLGAVDLTNLTGPKE